MKIKPETTLFTVPFGSHLYGTNGPASDIDLKAVCLPALDDLLLNKKLTNRKVKPSGDDGKVLPGETEIEYLPLQVFLDDFFNGQTYALEVAFACRQGLHTAGDYGQGETTAWWFAKDVIGGALIDRFLTRNVDKMVGYAVTQSRQYGLKTRRYTAMKSVIELVEKLSLVATHHLPTLQWSDKLRPMDTPTLVGQLLQLEHVKGVMIENAEGGSELAPALEVCGKKFPYTNRWSTILASLNKSLATYGDRVKQFDGEGVDWKALSHAIRITEQVLELSRTGELTFPRPTAPFLKAVKEGRVPLDEATAYLTERFNELDGAVEKSVLPAAKTPELEAEFEQFKLTTLRALYGL
jgi:hypothetical protein